MALGLGLLYVYTAAPRKKVRVTYPTPLNAGKITYRDKGGNCFKIAATEVPCDETKYKIKKQTIQEEFLA